MKNVISKTVLSSDGFSALSYSRNHKVFIDRPINEGGNDTAPTPIEYLLVAISSCVSMTLRVFSNKKKWNLGEITVNVSQKNKLTSVGLVTTLIEEISFSKNVSEKQKEELLIAASKCPVLQLLKNETKIKTIIL
ncbi:OsmC family protein [Flavobacteriaceae bacterium]|nr:OsmC family protein [Flavobacteriaceae bacterium]